MTSASYKIYILSHFYISQTDLMINILYFRWINLIVILPWKSPSRWASPTLSFSWVCINQECGWISDGVKDLILKSFCTMLLLQVYTAPIIWYCAMCIWIVSSTAAKEKSWAAQQTNQLVFWMIWVAYHWNGEKLKNLIHICILISLNSHKNFCWQNFVNWNSCVASHSSIW